MVGDESRESGRNQIMKELGVVLKDLELLPVGD
jgi:hypothetical protein